MPDKEGGGASVIEPPALPFNWLNRVARDLTASASLRAMVLHGLIATPNGTGTGPTNDGHPCSSGLCFRRFLHLNSTWVREVSLEEAKVVVKVGLQRKKLVRRDSFPLWYPSGPFRMAAPGSRCLGARGGAALRPRLPGSRSADRRGATCPPARPLHS
jgi:hypothetical protein